MSDLTEHPEWGPTRDRIKARLKTMKFEAWTPELQVLAEEVVRLIEVNTELLGALKELYGEAIATGMVVYGKRNAALRDKVAAIIERAEAK